MGIPAPYRQTIATLMRWGLKAGGADPARAEEILRRVEEGEVARADFMGISQLYDKFLAVLAGEGGGQGHPVRLLPRFGPWLQGQWRGLVQRDASSAAQERWAAGLPAGDESSSSSPEIARAYHTLYLSSPRLVVEDGELGRIGIVAAVRRGDLPEIGPSNRGEHGFVEYGLPFVVVDALPGGGLPLSEQTYYRLVAAHEFAELVLQGHDEAVRLEIALAAKWGLLGSYLELLRERYAEKFEDLLSSRFGQELRPRVVKGRVFEAMAPGEVERWQRRLREFIRRHFPGAEKNRKGPAGSPEEDLARSRARAREILARVHTGFFFGRATEALSAAASLPSREHALVRDREVALRLAFFRPLTVWRAQSREGMLKINGGNGDAGYFLGGLRLQLLREGRALDLEGLFPILAEDSIPRLWAAIRAFADLELRIAGALGVEPKFRRGEDSSKGSWISRREGAVSFLDLDEAREVLWRAALEEASGAALRPQEAGARGRARAELLALRRLVQGMERAAPFLKHLNLALDGIGRKAERMDWAGGDDFSATFAERAGVAVRGALEGRGIPSVIVKAWVAAIIPHLWDRWLSVHQGGPPFAEVRASILEGVMSAAGLEGGAGVPRLDAAGMRLARLSALHEVSVSPVREELESVAFRVLLGDFKDRVGVESFQTASAFLASISARVAKGEISEGLAAGAVRAMLQDRLYAGVLTSLLPRTDVVFLLSAAPGAHGLDAFLDISRRAIVARLWEELRADPFLIRALVASRDFWDGGPEQGVGVGAAWRRRAGELFLAANQYPMVLPQLGSDLRERGVISEDERGHLDHGRMKTAEFALWMRMDVPGALERALFQPPSAADLELSSLAKGLEGLPSLTNTVLNYPPKIPGIETLRARSTFASAEEFALAARIKLVEELITWGWKVGEAVPQSVADMRAEQLRLAASDQWRRMRDQSFEGNPPAPVEMPSVGIDVGRFPVALWEVPPEERDSFLNIYRVVAAHALWPGGTTLVKIAPFAWAWRRAASLLGTLPIPEVVRAKRELHLGVALIADHLQGRGVLGSGISGSEGALRRYGREDHVPQVPNDLDIDKVIDIREIDAEWIGIFTFILDGFSTRPFLPADRAFLLDRAGRMYGHAAWLQRLAREMRYDDPFWFVLNDLREEAAAYRVLAGQAMRLAVLWEIQKGGRIGGEDDALLFLSRSITFDDVLSGKPLPDPLTDPWLRGTWRSVEASDGSGIDYDFRGTMIALEAAFEKNRGGGKGGPAAAGRGGGDGRGAGSAPPVVSGGLSLAAPQWQKGAAVRGFDLLRRDGRIWRPATPGWFAPGAAAKRIRGVAAQPPSAFPFMVGGAAFAFPATAGMMPFLPMMSR